MVVPELLKEKNKTSYEDKGGRRTDLFFALARHNDIRLQNHGQHATPDTKQVVEGYEPIILATVMLSVARSQLVQASAS